MWDDAANDYFRVAGYSIAFFDIIQTIPAEWRLYRDAWTTWKLLAIAISFALTRYMSVVSLITGAIGAFGSSFTGPECSRLHLSPIITQLIATFAAEAIVLVKTFSIAKRSQGVLFVLGLAGFFGFFLHIFGTLYLRHSIATNGKCASLVHTQQGFYDSGTLYFVSSLVFFSSSALLSAAYIYSQTKSSPLSSFTRTMWAHRVHLMGIMAFVNLLCVLASINLPGFRNLGWTLPNAIQLITAHHVAISTFDTTAWGRVDHPVIDESQGINRRRKSSQIELRGIQIQREMVTQTEVDIRDEEDQRRSARFGRQNSMTDWQSQHDEKVRSLASDDAMTPAAQYALNFDISARY